MENHAYENSDPVFDSVCKICGGKRRDAVHRVGSDFDFGPEEEAALAETWDDIRKNGWESLPDGF